MTTGAWCMLINRWGRKYACRWREKKEMCEWQKVVRQHSPRYQKVAKFASPHKSPNRMWYMLQKVRLETRCIWYKGKEIGTVLHMVWQQARFFFFLTREGGKLCFSDSYGGFLKKFTSRSVWTTCILQRTRAIGCWIYITKDPELSQGVKV